MGAPARSDPLPLTTGSRLGPYEVLSLLGSGGMGLRDARAPCQPALPSIEDKGLRSRGERRARRPVTRGRGGDVMD
jgi:hypothetical protein